MKRSVLLIIGFIFFLSTAGFAPCVELEKLKNSYLKDRKYSEFVEYLNGQKTPQAAYYAAQARYEQLKYFEESQNWDEYFNKGNDYRAELENKAQEALRLTTSSESVNVMARCLLWQFHSEQKDVFEQQALEDLTAGLREYARQEAIDIAPIKYVADKLSAGGENVSSREMYNIYVAKLITPETKEEVLEQVADEVYQQGNASLATLIYDAYIERISQSYPKDTLLTVLLSIAKRFAYKDKGLSDPEYAEKVFKKAEDLGGLEAFDEPDLYLRSWNLEKYQDYLQSKEKYLVLLERCLKTSHRDEAIFKCGMIAAYIGRDINMGRSYFEQLSASENISPQVISSLYQLGLLAQWEKDLEKAKSYYSRLLELAGKNYPETVALTEKRLKELEAGGEIEYNLRTFMDVSLREEYAYYDMSKVELKSSLYRPIKDEEVKIMASPNLAESGCMSVEISYLWSGHLGKSEPSTEQQEFSTSYLHAGTKEVNLVVVAPAGILDRRLDMLDDYNQ